MDTGAIRSCINYRTFSELNIQLSPKEIPKVVGADRGDLRSMDSVELMNSSCVDSFEETLSWVLILLNIIVLESSGQPIEHECCY